jgi:hypothetical protein
MPNATANHTRPASRQGRCYDAEKEAVMFELNEQQGREPAGPEPVAVGDGTDEDLRLLLARSSAANGWDEPETADDDDYDAHRAT